jgi:hypothetical protein
VDGSEVARATVRRTVPGAFSASASFDVGMNFRSRVSLDYLDRCPFAFNGTIHSVLAGLNRQDD